VRGKLVRDGMMDTARSWSKLLWGSLASALVGRFEGFGQLVRATPREDTPRCSLRR